MLYTINAVNPILILGLDPLNWGKKYQFTVKPVHKGHPGEPMKVTFMSKGPYIQVQIAFRT